MLQNPEVINAGKRPSQLKDAYAWIKTINKTNSSVWITIYDVGKTQHLDWGCLGAGQSWTWWSGNYAWGSFYYVRGEVKQNTDCGGDTTCDTTIEVNPQNGSSNIVSITVGSDGNCSWSCDNC